MAKKNKYSLVSLDGNAFNIMGYTDQCMEIEGFTEEERGIMYSEATSGDYTHLLGVCNKYINECNKRANR